MKKQKIYIAVIIGLVTMLLVAVMFAQFKTIENTDITSIEAMRESELRTTLANWKTKYEETEKQLQDINAKIAEYKEKGVNDQETEQLLEQELKEANLLLRKNRSGWRRSNSNSI